MFKPLLQTIVEQTPGAQSAILMGCDGIAVDSFSATAQEGGQSVVVEFATVVREVAHTASLLSVGDLEEITVRCENMTIILTLLTAEYFVALLIGRDGMPSKGRYVVRRDAHLLQAALKEILGDHVQQVGSNITEERLRFDFVHPQRLADEEIQRVEKLVNQKIKENLAVRMETMSFEESQKQGASAFFKGRYPEIVKVYSIGNLKGGRVFSKEVCAGPHVRKTGVLGCFKIVKEESCGSGKRRIYAVLED